MRHTDIGGRSVRPGGDRSRSLVRRVVLRLLSAGLALAGLGGIRSSAEADESKVGGAVNYAGRVIDLETGRPIAGAEVVLERSIRGGATPIPAWVGASTMRTDADGRFPLSFPPEQVAESRLCIEFRIRHPDYIPRRAYKVPLAEIIRGQARGEEPFFSRITLERGVEYMGLVVVTGGKPAPGIPYWFENWARGKNLPSPSLVDDTEGQTDDDGRIRIRMLKTQALAIYLGPPRTARARFPYAPYQHFWGTDTGSEHPDVWAPTDLGRIELSRGIRLPGRMIDTDGQPIAGQTITAFSVRGRLRHSTATEADGSFSLGPFRPGNYLIYGEGQDLFGGVEPDAPSVRRPIRVVRPVRVYLQEGVTPEPLVLRELPTVQVEVRFVDSQGKPARGSATKVWGLLPTDRGLANPFGAHTKVGGGLASTINDPEPRDTAERIDWSLQDRPDAEGRTVFSVPRGLREATLDTFPFDETVAFKTRLEPNGPLKYWGGGRLGAVDSDRQITIVSYRAPTVLVTVKAVEGPLPDDIEVNATFIVNGGGYGGRFTRQPDGRFRGQSLMPDHEYEIAAWGQRGAYVPTKIHRIRLPEGGSTELTLTVRKRPAPPQVGKRAPSFSVHAVDGREVSLAGLRGKTVLLHFWQPNRTIQDAPSLKAVHDRFGTDRRFAMLGLCVSSEPEAAAQAIRSLGFAWPQALLRDRGADPIFLDYAARSPYRPFLIGPDGTLIGRDLAGAALEKAVADALAGKPGGSGAP